MCPNEEEDAVLQTCEGEGGFVWHVVLKMSILWLKLFFVLFRLKLAKGEHRRWTYLQGTHMSGIGIKLQREFEERAHSNLHRPEERASLHSLLHSGYPDLEETKRESKGFEFRAF